MTGWRRFSGSEPAAMLSELQEAFRHGLLSGDDAAAQAAVRDSAGLAAEARLEIYRNNVFQSLVAVLGAAYPAAASVLGEAAFRTVAAAFIKRHPPRLPQLSAYGDELPEFLVGLGATSRPFLPDLARLEWARNESYFEADATPIDLATLRAVPAEHAALLRMTLHPTVRLLGSRYDVLALWHEHLGDSAPPAPPPPCEGDRYILIARPGVEVQMAALSAGTFTLALGLRLGLTLARAAHAAMLSEPGFALEGALAQLLSHSTFTSFALSDPAESALP